MSVGGWITLIKASLSKLPLHRMSLFPIPKGIIEIICKIQWQFFLCGDYERKSLPFVSWNLMELPKNLGGLGVGNLLHHNISLLSHGGRDSKWNLPYGARLSMTNMDIIHHFLWMISWYLQMGVPWKNICSSLLLYLNAKTIALSRVRKGLGDGSSTLFWHDFWVGVSPLNILFPSLFLLSMTQILQYLQWVLGTSNWDWSPAWRRDLRPHDILEFEQLFSSLNQVSLNASSHDNFVLNLDKVGNFSVKSLMKELDKISRHIPADNLKKV